MQIRYKNDRVKKDCTDYNHAKKNYSDQIAKGIRKIINFIEAVPHLSDVINHRPFYFHRSKDNLYSLDIGGRKSSYRLLFSLDEDVDDLFSAAKAIKVIIIERVDKHD